MLDNAIKYENELKEKFIDVWYDNDYKYYFENDWRSEFEIPKNDYEQRSFVSLDKDNNIIGYISYNISRHASTAYAFNAINFSKNKFVFGKDLYNVIDDIFCKFNMNRLEFDVVVGNPAEKSYDKMVEKYNGRIVGTKRQSIKLIDGRLYDEKLYEILKDDYLSFKV
jgi:hypothetical protein